MQKEEDLRYLIAIGLLPNIGLRYSKSLIEYFGSAREVFMATKQDIESIPNIRPSLVSAILEQKEKALRRADKELDFIAAHRLSAFSYQDDDYPYRLRECQDAPILLFGKGNLNLNERHFLSVVGTRMPTERGKELCRKMILEMAALNNKLTIVSGLAYGIDITAHRAALEVGLPTIIVPGHGLDRIYPAVHRNTAVEALQNGGILTEYMAGTNPDRQNFVARNRIVAGMSDATLVVESKEKGGALITAEMANSYGRDVFAVPGRTDDVCSRGCNILIKQNKAMLAESGKDIIQAMQWDTNSSVDLPVQTKLFTDLTEKESTLLSILHENVEGVHINLLVMETKMPYSEVSSLLLQMEFRAIVKSLPGGIYRALE